MKQYEGKNLLIIYQDSTKHINTSNLEGLFNIIYIPKIKRNDINDFKYKGNHLVTRYNDILYTTNSDLAFFICSSEFNELVMKTLLNFKRLDSDFDFITGKKTNNLITYLSGLVVKKEVLIRIGCFDKHTFYNLYLNFLINYSRFYGLVPNSSLIQIKISSLNFLKFSYWKFFEKSSYLCLPLHKEYYLILSKEMQSIICNNTQKKIIDAFMNWKMNRLSSKTEKIVQSVTYLEYW